MSLTEITESLSHPVSTYCLNLLFHLFIISLAILPDLLRTRGQVDKSVLVGTGGEPQV